MREEAFYALQSALKQSEIKYHSLPSRVKKIESFLDKVRIRGAKNPEETKDSVWNPFQEIHDIVGLRVVCLYLSDLARIALVIRNIFEVLAEDNKIEGAEVTSFGYMSVHFVCAMKKEYIGPRYDNIVGLPFEIQVRTIAMDAWANVSHHLDYKSDKDVPAELRKDFYALSGLFYVADRHFEMFYTQSKQSRQQMKELFEDAVTDARTAQQLNLDSLGAYLQAKFPDRRHLGSNEVSDLLSPLLKAGYSTIGEIDEIIEYGKRAFRLYEEQHPPFVTQGKKFFTDVGVVRITMSIFSKKFLREDRRLRIPDEVELDQSVRAAWEKYGKYRKLAE